MKSTQRLDVQERQRLAENGYVVRERAFDEGAVGYEKRSTIHRY